MTAHDDGFVEVGRINGLYGVRGWVKVFSHTQPRDNIVHYDPWYLQVRGELRPARVAEGRLHGKGVVVRLEGYDDREQARELIGTDILVQRGQFAPPEPGEYYWADLVGLRVVTVDGVELGRVDHLVETGANDVMAVVGERERLIPFVLDQVVTEVDLEGGLLRVDWDPEF